MERRYKESSKQRISGPHKSPKLRQVLTVPEFLGRLGIILNFQFANDNVLEFGPYIFEVSNLNQRHMYDGITDIFLERV